MIAFIFNNIVLQTASIFILQSQSMASQYITIPKRPPCYINNQLKTPTSSSLQNSSPINVFSKAIPPWENNSLDNNKLIPSPASNVSKTLEISFNKIPQPNKNVITLATPLRAPEVKTTNPIVLPQNNLASNQLTQGLFQQTNNQVFNSQTGLVFPNATLSFSNNLQNNNQQMFGNVTQNTTFFNQSNNQFSLNLGNLGAQVNQPFINNNSSNFFQPQPQPDPYNSNPQYYNSYPTYPQNIQYPQSPYDQQSPNYPQNTEYLQNPQDFSLLHSFIYPLEEQQRSQVYNQIITYLDQQVTGYQDLFQALAIFSLCDSCNDWELIQFHPNQLMEFVDKFALMTSLQSMRRKEIQEYNNSLEGLTEINRLGYLRYDERNFQNYYDEYIQSALETIFKDERQLSKIIQTNPALTKQIIDNRSHINGYLSRKISDEFRPFEPSKRQMNEHSSRNGELSGWRESQQEETKPSDNWRTISAENATFGAGWVIEVEQINKEQRFRELMAKY